MKAESKNDRNRFETELLKAIANCRVALGKDLLLRLKTSLGVDGLKQITDAITPAQLKTFIDEIGEQGIQEFGAKALAEVGRHLSPGPS